MEHSPKTRPQDQITTLITEKYSTLNAAAQEISKQHRGVRKARESIGEGIVIAGIGVLGAVAAELLHAPVTPEVGLSFPLLVATMGAARAGAGALVAWQKGKGLTERAQAVRHERNDLRHLKHRKSHPRLAPV